MRNAIAVSTPPPSPGAPGEGWGEGLRSDDRPSVGSKTPTPTLSRRTGRGTAAALLLLIATAGCPEPPAQVPPPGPLASGRAALRADRFDAAIADADDSLRGQPHGPEAAEANYIKGYAFQNKSFQDAPADRREDLVAARSAYQAALAERPPALLQGYVRTGLSNVALYEDDFPTAIEQAAAAMPLVDRPQTKAGLLYNTGLAQQRLSRFGEADQTFRQVIQQNPGTPPAAAAAEHLGPPRLLRRAAPLRHVGRGRPGRPLAPGHRVGPEPPVRRRRPHRPGPGTVQHLPRRPPAARRPVRVVPDGNGTALTPRQSGGGPRPAKVRGFRPNSDRTRARSRTVLFGPEPTRAFGGGIGPVSWRARRRLCGLQGW